MKEGSDLILVCREGRDAACRLALPDVCDREQLLHGL